jgi:hypothetical protein
LWEWLPIKRIVERIFGFPIWRIVGNCCFGFGFPIVEIVKGLWFPIMGIVEDFVGG